MPIVKASKVSELTFRSGAVILGKEAIGEAAGWAGSELTGLITDNEQIKMIAGMASSFATGKVSNKVDDYFNLSRKPFLSGMSADDAVRYNKYWTVSESTCTQNELYKYLYSIDHNLAEEYLLTGRFSQDIQVPKSSSVLKSNGDIDWSNAPKGGYVLDAVGNPIKEVYMPVKGEIIDRYGKPDGRYTSPVIDGKSYDYSERSLPFVEDSSQYHRYEIVGDFNEIEKYIENCSDLTLKAQVDATVTKYYDGDYSKLLSYKGEAAPITDWGVGGATQYELCLSIDQLEKLGLIKEIK